jgi:GT2 family glycosyltransferase
METIDVVMLTKSSSEKEVAMTLRTLYSLRDSETDFRFNVHLVESGFDYYHRYIRTAVVANYIQPKEKFNYNKFLNLGFEHVKADWVIISNNDVSYEKNWLSEIMAIHKQRPDIHSFSPKDPVLYMTEFDWHFIDSDTLYFENYRVHEALMGWCLVIKKESLDLIRPFDEQFDMYYQDDDYAMMLIKNKIKHALVRHSIVSHLQSITINALSEEKIKKMQEGKIKFETKWK